MTGLISSTSHNHFLHTNALLRHACGGSADSERDIETILTENRFGEAPSVGRPRCWVKEALAVADLESLAFDELKSDDPEASGRRLSLLRLQSYTDDAPVRSDVLAALELTRVKPVLQLRQVRQSMPAV